MESGISGLARPREWDATAVVDIPKPVASGLASVSFRAYDESIETSSAPSEIVARFVEELDRFLRRPYAGLATRQTETTWAVAGREFKADSIPLGRRLPASRLEVTVSPAGERTARVDGEPVEGEIPAATMAALAEVESLGRKRFQAFVARADRRNDENWELTIDPL